MKTLFFTFCFLTLWSIEFAYSQMSFTITGKQGSTASVTLTAPVAALMQAVVDDVNTKNGCNMIAKTCPRGGAFQTVMSYLTDRVNEAFDASARQVREKQKASACEIWKTLTTAKKDAITTDLGGNPPCAE